MPAAYTAGTLYIRKVQKLPAGFIKKNMIQWGKSLVKKQQKEIKDMMLFMPTIVFSEDDCVKNHGSELSLMGKKAMIVTGKKSSRINGSLDDVENALKERNIPYIIFDEIEENPSVETVMRAREKGIEEKVDFVIGIGGGSPLDASKAIALMIANPDKDENILYDSTPLPYIPVACIPTTCGTGSEVTPYSILTLHKQRTKKSISHKIYPTVAFIDGRYLKTASRNYLVSTAVDALAHLVESYLNTNSNELNKIYSREGLIMWGSLKEKLLTNKITEEDYNKLMHASMIAGMAITHTGTSLPHGLSYMITYELGIPHGKAVGMFLGGYVSVYKDKTQSEEVLSLLGFESCEAFKNYLGEILGDVELPEGMMEKNADLILSNKAKLKNYPFNITREEILSML